MSKNQLRCPFCFAECDETSVGKPCSICNSIVPESVKDSILFPIVVVGPSGAGKTHFLTVLAHLLCEGAVWPSYWAATREIRHTENHENEGNEAKYDDEFVGLEELLYPQKGARGQILQQTTKRSETDVPRSLVILLHYVGGLANVRKEPYRKRNVLLSFTDTAGEDLVHKEWGEVSKKYPILGKKLAKGLIALVNPTQLAMVRDEYTAANAASKGKFEQSGLQLSVFATLQSVLSIPEIRKPMKRKPIAVCLTKTDALAALDKIDPQDAMVGTMDIVSGTTQDEGRINLENLDLLSARTEAFMAEMDNDQGFQDGKPTLDGISGAARFFKYRAFFATDALGTAIQTTTSATDREGNPIRMFSGFPRPRRILDPLLWMLWQYGYVGGHGSK